MYVPEITALLEFLVENSTRASIVSADGEEEATAAGASSEEKKVSAAEAAASPSEGGEQVPSKRRTASLVAQWCECSLDFGVGPHAVKT